MSECVFFDIETAPLPDAILLEQWGPCEHLEPPGEFDQESVKYGNLRKQDLREKKLLEAIASHQSLVDGFASRQAALESGHVAELRGKATLHAESGVILTIGRKYNGQYHVPEACEADQIAEFWNIFTFHRNNGNILVGFNCKEFDLPWILRRSYANNIRPPMGLLDKDRWWHPCIVDLMQKWSLCCYGGIHKPSLHRLAILFGMDGKTEDGGKLYEIWETDRQRALEYVRHDLDMTEAVAKRMFVA